MKLTEVHRVLNDMFNKELTNELNRHVVFWYDEDGEFKGELETLELESVRIWTLTESNLFATKYELETNDTTSHFLIYANMVQPLPNEDWLYNQYAMGQEFATDKTTIIMREIGVTDEGLRDTFKEYRQFFNNNTRLRAFMKFPVEVYTEELVDLIVLAVLVKSKTNTLDDSLRVILSYSLNEPNQAWEQIQKFGNEEKFWLLVEKYYGYTLQDKSLSSLMIFLLITYTAQQNEFVELPVTWESYVSSRPTNSVVFIDQWMNHREDYVHYNELSDHIAMQIKVDQAMKIWQMADIVEMDAFRLFDNEIIDYIVRQLLMDFTDFETYKNLILKRRNLHWYKEYQYDYEAVFQAIHLFQKVKEIEQFIPEQSSYDLFQIYTKKYYVIDQAYRKFYMAYDRVEVKDSLYKLREKVERLYSNWFVDELAMKWEASLTQNGGIWPLEGISQQKDFFRNWVKPYQSDGERVFIIVSDALRYEVAEQLMDELNNERRATTELAGIQSSLPSFTALGMASLLPHQELTLTEKGHIYCDDMNTSGTENRNKIIREASSDSLAVLFNDIQAMNRQSFRDTFSGKKIVYVYHNSIDAMGDNQATESNVFAAAEEAISDIRSLVNQLVNNLSASNILITSDHGFLYQRDPVAQSQKVSQKSDDVLLTNRRFMISNTLLDLEGTANYSMKGIVDNGEKLFVTVPKGANRFAVQGSGANYVHGGTMLQEIAIPVITFKNDRSKSTLNEVKTVDLKLTTTLRKITSTVTYLEFFQTAAIGEKMRPRYLSVYFTDENSERVSNEIKITTDSEAMEARDRAFKARFIFKSKTYDRRKIYFLTLKDTFSNQLYEQYEFNIDIVHN